MARKTYTEEDRARVRQALLDTGLTMAVSKGLKGLHLAELAAAVGISKPYFYTFFDSLEDFSLQMMEEQRCRLLRLLEQELARPEGIWEEHVESFFRTILRHRENGILVMTQGEEADLHSRLTPERFQDFRPGQRDFFLRLMALLDIRQEDCAPEVLANLVFSWPAHRTVFPEISGGDGGAAREIFGELSGLPAQRKKRPLMGGLFLCADNYPVAQSGFFWYDISYIDQIK